MTDCASKKCELCKKEMIIKINGLDFKQAMKVLLLHERNRHYSDIANINKDLEALKDVEIPEVPIDSWFDVSK